MDFDMKMVGRKLDFFAEKQTVMSIGRRRLESWEGCLSQDGETSFRILLKVDVMPRANL